MNDKKKNPGQHWDREQWAPDTEGPPSGEQGETWNRHQWSPDNTGTDSEHTTRADAGREADADLPGDMDDPAVGGLSGGGQPSGESHWARTDRTDRTDRTE